MDNYFHKSLSCKELRCAKSNFMSNLLLITRPSMLATRPYNPYR